MKTAKVIFLSVVICFFITETFSEEKKKDCSKIENLYQKIVCKTNNATSGITSKKTLADFFKKKKQ